MSATEQQRVLVINGPNLNRLGLREPELYGHGTLKELEHQIQEWAASLGQVAECVQSNHEGELIDAIHAGADEFDAIIINPAAFTHTSVALRDAIASVNLPFVEVHITNVYKRESFRRHSYFSEIAEAVIAGAGFTGYHLALQYLNSRQ